MNKYAFEFSPDGKTWIRERTNLKINKAWQLLTGTEARKFKLLNPAGKVRLVNLKTTDIIGEDQIDN